MLGTIGVVVPARGVGMLWDECSGRSLKVLQRQQGGVRKGAPRERTGFRRKIAWQSHATDSNGFRTKPNV